MIDTLQMLLGGFSGMLVGFTLGLVGGGGSILAVPLMIYLVGVSSPTSPSAPVRLPWPPMRRWAYSTMRATGR